MLYIVARRMSISNGSPDTRRGDGCDNMSWHPRIQGSAIWSVNAFCIPSNVMLATKQFGISAQVQFND
jgi:hypothetical protein